MFMTHLTYLGHMQEMCKNCHHPSWIHNGSVYCLEHLSILYAGNLSETRFPVYSKVHEMSLIRSCVRTLHIEYLFNVTYPVYRENVHEIPCVTVNEMRRVLGTGNVDEIPCVQVPKLCMKLCPILYQKMYKYPVVRNVHSMNRKCDQSYTFLGISIPRKFKISFSVGYLFSVHLPGCFTPI